MNRTGLPRVIGVAGAGTMGADIAQLALSSGGKSVILADPDYQAREQAEVGIRRGLMTLVESGRIDQGSAEESLGRLRIVKSAGELGECELVIEAVPERLDLKRETLAQVAASAGPKCVIATNTSSLSVTAIAKGVPVPSRVLGMHFFNPAPLMPLIEVVAGLETGQEAVSVARSMAEAMGKQVVLAADTPGFVVNRCNRPFSLEALRLVRDGIATPEQVDRICRLAGGFRMGPFELMDLVGIDVGVAVSESFFEQSYGEPRWRPSPLAVRMAAAGRLGRKTARGWYSYPADDVPYRPPDPALPQAGGGDGHLTVLGRTRLADEIAAAAQTSGWDVGREPETGASRASLILDCTPTDPNRRGEEPRVVLCDGAPLAAVDPSGEAVGFMTLPPFEVTKLVELTRTARTNEQVAQAAEAFFTSLGRHVEWVGDAPGLVLGRIIAQLVNETWFALGESVASEEDIDRAMILALKHPRGPAEWGRTIGARNVLRILDGLLREYGDPAYRPAPGLTRAARVQGQERTNTGDASASDS